MYDHVNGATPPVRCSWYVYELPMIAFGSVFVLIVGGEAAPTAIENCCGVASATPFVSVTDAVKLIVPTVVGTPETTPAAGKRVRPAGKAGAAHMYGPVPPVALSTVTYGVPAIAAASGAAIAVFGLITTGALTVIVRDLRCGGRRGVVSCSHREGARGARWACR